MTHTEMLEEARRIETGKPLTENSDATVGQNNPNQPGNDRLQQIAASDIGPALLIGAGLTWMALNQIRRRRPDLIPQVVEKTKEAGELAEERIIALQKEAKAGMSHMAESAHDNMEAAKERLVKQAKSIAERAKHLAPESHEPKQAPLSTRILEQSENN